MDPLVIAAVLTVALFTLLAAGVWVSMTLMLLGLLTMVMLDNSAYGLIFATTTWGASSSWALTALPLFIWMGEILFRTRLSKDLFEGLAPWLSKFPGQLFHVNILSCGIFWG